MTRSRILFLGALLAALTLAPGCFYVGALPLALIALGVGAAVQPKDKDEEPPPGPAADTTPPATIADLAASTGTSSGTVDLTWTAPGDDGAVGNAAGYVVKYYAAAIDAANWDSATVFVQSWTPLAAGQAESRTVAGLTPGNTYYFAVRAQDEVPNLGAVSNSPSAQASTAADTTAPAAISNLAAATGGAAGTVDLGWTAPGDDGSTGTAASYLVKYHTSAIDGTNWASATTYAQSWTPKAAGQAEAYTVTALTPGATYFFAVRAQDEVPNLAAVSNSPSAQACSAGDVTPPAAVANLAAAQGTAEGTVTLTWTAPGDDGSTGTADCYVLKYSKRPIAASAFDSAATFPQSWTPATAGTGESKTLTGLVPGIRYFFAIKAKDENGNLGGISNVVWGLARCSSLLAYWPLEDGSGTTATDISGNNNNGTLNGCTWTTGAVGGALQFNGTSDYVDTGVLFSTAASGSFTFSLMCSTLTTYAYLIATTTGVSDSNKTCRDLCTGTGGHPQFWTRDQTGTSNSAQSPATCNDGAFHHLAGVYDGSLSMLMIYVDGNLAATAGFSGSLQDVRSIFFGANHDVGNTVNAHFAGKLDEVKIFTSARTPEQIREEYVNSDPPAAIADLAAVAGSSIGTVSLTWTSPYADGGTSGGRASSYIVKYSSSAMTAGNFDSAATFPQSWTPAPAGSGESRTVTGLAAGTWYFAVKSVDDDGNPSAISNVVSAAAGTGADTLAPAPITDLKAWPGASSGSVLLEWTAPGDDLGTGTASSFTLKRSTSPILTDSEFTAAATVSGPPTPLAAGSRHSMTVSGLPTDTMHYFALKATDDSSNVSAISNCAVEYAYVWRRMAPAGALPAGRTACTNVVDTKRTRLIVFGGYTSGYVNDLWELNLEGYDGGWKQLSPGGTPPGGRDQAFGVYDEYNDRMVTFGGYSGGRLNQTWSLSFTGGANGTWAQLSPSGTSLPALAEHSAVWDSANRRMIVFGGTTGPGPTQQTTAYALDLRTPGSETWSTLSPSGTLPPGLEGHAATVDTRRNRMLVAGGNTASGYSIDIWSLSIGNPGGESWSPLNPQGTRPAATENHTAVYDPINDRVIVWGFRAAADDHIYVITFSENPEGRWHQLDPGTVFPAYRYAHVGLYDPFNQRMVISLGIDSVSNVNDTWALPLPPLYVGDGWKELHALGQKEFAKGEHNFTYGSPSISDWWTYGGDGPSGWSTDIHVLEKASSGAQRWRKITPVGGNPGTRGIHTAFTDSVRNRMIFAFGRDQSSTDWADVWAFNVSSQSWSHLSPTGTGPSLGMNAVAGVFDRIRNRAVLFGGSTGSYNNNAWELSFISGLNGSWTLLSPSGTPPAARAGHVAVFDDARDRMLVFAGHTGSFVNDTWSLDFSGGSNGLWTQLTTFGTLPAARSALAGYFDPQRNRFVIFGGTTGTLLNDIHELTLCGNLGIWTQLQPAGTLPGARRSHGGSYSPLEQKALFLDGFQDAGGSADWDDLWQLKPPVPALQPAWRQMSPSNMPSPVHGECGIIHDELNDRVIIFGGHDSGDLNDVHALSLSATSDGSWTQISPSGTPPGARFAMCMAYDGLNNRALVTRGSGGYQDLFALSLTPGSEAWTSLSPSGGTVPLRFHATTILDRVNKRMILFGGYMNPPLTFFNDVWALDVSSGGNGTWTQLSPTGTPPAARQSHAAVYDPATERMIVFGGENSGTYYSETWALNLAGGGNGSWSQLSPSGTPPQGLYGQGMFFDTKRRCAIVFAGSATASGPRYNTVDALDFTASGNGAWTTLSPLSTLPSARENIRGIWDPARDRMIIYAGYTGGPTPVNDQWELRFFR